MTNSVFVPVARLLEALTWAKRHCATYITNDYLQDTNSIEFFFCPTEQGQREMLMFTLKFL
jgi:hypothetical protein